VLVIVDTLTRANGYAPTYRDIADCLGVRSVYTAWGHIEALTRKGLVTHRRRVARSLRLTDAGRAVLGVAS
jgi:Mn-dependent DtxR family transcriptional regulator